MPEIKWRKKAQQIFGRSLIVGLLLIFISLISVCGCSQQPSEEYKKNSPSAQQINVFISDISPDGKTLLFEYGSPYWAKIGTYDLSTGEVHRYKDDKINKMMERPKYSWDGERILYLVGREKDEHQNIYIMNADGSNRQQITNTQKMYGIPAFAPDRKRIIFSRWHMSRKRAFPLEGEMKTAWDLYELDIASGNERRLTNYNFYEISMATYMADGKHFIFSAEGPVNTTGMGPKNFEEYEKMYQKNFIFIMDGINNKLKPAFTNGSNSAIPFAASNKSIVFVSEIGRENSPKKTQELFLYKKGEIIQLTNLGAYIRWGMISRDGSTIIFPKYSDRGSFDESDWIMKSDGTGLKKIDIPMDELKK